MRGARRLERYARAAAERATRIKRRVRPSRAEERAARLSCPCGDPGCRNLHDSRGHGSKDKMPAARSVRFLEKLRSLPEKVVAAGDGLPYETRLELYDSAVGLLAQQLGIDPADLEGVHPTCTSG